MGSGAVRFRGGVARLHASRVLFSPSLGCKSQWRPPPPLADRPGRGQHYATHHSLRAKSEWRARSRACSIGAVPTARASVSRAHRDASPRPRIDRLDAPLPNEEPKRVHVRNVRLASLAEYVRVLSPGQVSYHACDAVPFRSATARIGRNLQAGRREVAVVQEPLRGRRRERQHVIIGHAASAVDGHGQIPHEARHLVRFGIYRRQLGVLLLQRRKVRMLTRVGFAYDARLKIRPRARPSSRRPASIGCSPPLVGKRLRRST